MFTYAWALFPNALSRHSFCYRAFRKTTIAGWRERRKRGKCVCVEWSMARLSSESKASKGVSALKIKRYWLKSETVTFQWDGIYYSEKKQQICSLSLGKEKKKHPFLIKTLFGLKDLISSDESSLWFLPFSQKVRFLIKHFLKQILPLLGFLSAEREGVLSTYIHNTRSCPSLHEDIMGQDL